MKKRIISILLAVVMVVAMIPTTMIAAFAEEPTSNVITLVGQATLDGENTNGEYDNATKVMLNSYGNDTDGDNMRIVYTDEAVYVLVEVFDNTVVNYTDYLDDGTTKAGSSKADTAFLGFKLGTSFQGIKSVYRGGTGRTTFQPEGTYVDVTTGYSTNGTLEDKYYAHINNGENGFTLEARFPVDEMTKYDQALYAAGQLEIRFTAGTQDGENKGTEFTVTYDGDTANRGWNGAAEDDYFVPSFATSYKAKNPSAYPAYKFEYVSDEEVLVPEEPIPETNFIAYAENAALDGVNTDGEYKNTYSKPFDGVYNSSGSYVASIKMVYSDDGIYVLVESAGVGAYASGDFFWLHLGIGTSIRGSIKVFRSESVTYTQNNGTSALEASDVVVNSTGWSAEIKIPVEKLNETDKTALTDGNLDIVAEGLVSSQWSGSGAYYTHSYAANEDATDERLAAYDKYTLLAKDTEFPEEVIPGSIAYVANPTLDGTNTNGEYNLTRKDTFVNVKGSNVYVGTMSIAYSDDGIYVLVYVKDTAAGGDYIFLHVAIGTSFVGTAQVYRGGSLEYKDISGSATSLDAANVVQVDGGSTGYTVEYRFPKDSFNDKDKAAFENGTVKIAMEAMSTSYYAQDVNTTTAETFSNQNYYITDAKLANYETRTLLKKGEAAGDKIAYVKNPALDGANTNGEYNNTYIDTEFELSKGSNKYEGTMSVVYGDDGIYALVHIDDPATGGDYIFLHVAIGTSFVGTAQVARGGALTYTDISGSATSLDAANVAQVDGGANGYTVEFKFPKDSFNAEDKTAFENRTIAVFMEAMSTSNWATDVNASVKEAYTVNGNYPASAEKFGFYNVRTLAEKDALNDATISKIAYVASPSFDGVNTFGEYDNTHVKNFGLVYNNSGSYDASIKIVYSDDGIYVLAESAGVSAYASGDFFWLHLGIGTSIRGLVNVLRSGDVTYNQLDGEKTLDSSDVKVNGSAWSVEIKIPVEKLTATDAAALADGTLDIVAEGLVSSNWSGNGAYYSYAGAASNTTTADKLASYPKYTLLAQGAVEDATTVSKFTGANLTLGESINVKYHAYIPTNKVAISYVKFTYNEKTTIVKPTEENPGDYVFTFEGLAPQCMGDNIAATLVVGGKAVDAVTEYSVLQNCKNLLNSDEVSDKTETLIYDLLAYGAAAQVYAKYKTDALVNAGYENNATVVDSVVNNDRVIGEPLADASITAVGVYFANINKLYVKFSADDASSVTVTINGKAVAFEQYSATQYIAYSEGIAVFDFDKVYTLAITTTQGTQTITYSVNAWASVKYDTTNAKTEALAKATYAYGQSAKNYIEEVCPQIKYEGKYISDVFTGKTALFLGDSICEAVCEGGKIYRGWAGRIQLATGLISTNKGKSSASISNCRGTNVVYNHYSTVRDNDYDFIIMHGGVNDAWDSISVGTVSDSRNPADFNLNTYAGGLENLFYYVTTEHPDAKLGYIFNFEAPACTAGRVSDMSEYFNVAKQICEKWNIPYLNLYEDEALSEELDATTTTNLYDFIHPSTAGYDILYTYIMYWMETLPEHSSITDGYELETLPSEVAK